MSLKKILIIQIVQVVILLKKCKNLHKMKIGLDIEQIFTNIEINYAEL